MPMTTLMAVLPSPDVRVTEAESLIRELGRVCECYVLRGMKLNTCETKTMIVSWSRTMHPLSHQLSIGGTVLKESDDLDILVVTFDSKMTFEKHLRSVCRAASRRLVSCGSSGEYSMIDLFLGDAFEGLSSQFWSNVLQCGALLPIHTLNYCM